MKTYTHPTITLPAGSVVVKFYDDAGTGTETTPNIIMEIGDVEEGFDISLGEFHAPTCDFKLSNLNNYVTQTLLANDAIRVSIVVNNEYYFFGEIDPESIDEDVLEIGGNKKGVIEFTAIHIFATLYRYTMKQVYDELILISDPDANYFYMRQFFRIISEQCFLKWDTFANSHVYELDRKYSYYDPPTPWVSCYLDEVMLRTLYYKLNNPLVYPNYISKRINNMFEMLGEIAREFFIYPSIVFDGTDFKLKIRDRDKYNEVTLPGIKKTNPYRKYILTGIITRLDNAPPTLTSNDFYYENNKAYKFKEEDFDLPLHYTGGGGTDTLDVTNSGTLNTTTGVTISVSDSINSSGEGTAVITDGVNTTQFSYSAKVNGAFLGCLISSGTFAFTSSYYITGVETFNVNMQIFVPNAGETTEYITRVSNNTAAGYADYDSLSEAIHNAYKRIYYDDERWRKFLLVGLKATISSTSKIEYLMPCYQFQEFSQRHLIHSVRKSVMRNETELIGKIIEDVTGEEEGV